MTSLAPGPRYAIGQRVDLGAHVGYVRQVANADKWNVVLPEHEAEQFLYTIEWYGDAPLPMPVWGESALALLGLVVS